MRKTLKFFIFITLLCNNQLSNAQSSPLMEIIAEADRLVEESKDKQVLFLLEQVDINDYRNESDVVLGTFYFEKAVAYGLNDSYPNCIQSFIKACDYYEKSGFTYGNDNFLLSLQSLGQIYYNLGNLDLSERCFRKIIIYETAHVTIDSKYKVTNYLYNAYCNLGIIYVDRKEKDKAEMCLSYLMQNENSVHNKYYIDLYNYINK